MFIYVIHTYLQTYLVLVWTYRKACIWPFCAYLFPSTSYSFLSLFMFHYLFLNVFVALFVFLSNLYICKERQDFVESFFLSSSWGLYKVIGLPLKTYSRFGSLTSSVFWALPKWQASHVHSLWSLLVKSRLIKEEEVCKRREGWDQHCFCLR
jgi:hypothetical protein